MNPHFKTYVEKILPFTTVDIRLPDSSLELWLQRMFKCFGDVKGKKILDYGAGTGHKSLLMAMLGADVSVIEINPDDIKAMRGVSAKLNLPITIYEAGIEGLNKLKDAEFDAILASEVFEHLPLPDASEFVRQIQRVLRPGGKLFLTTPNFNVYGPAEDAPEYYKRQPWGHHKHYTVDELKKAFSNTIFSFENHYFETHPLTLLRNRIFYPMARAHFAAHFSTSKKHLILRGLLKIPTWIVGEAWILAYPLIRKLHHFYEEQSSGKQSTGMTIILDIKRI